MSTAIGDLVVRLGAKTRGFDRKMSASTRMLGMMSKATRFLSSKLVMFGGAALAAAGVGGIGYMIKQEMASIDATAKMSDRIGIATEKLIGLRHAAELTGAGTDTLDAGLTTMAKRLGEAARGIGAAKPALEFLNLAAGDLIKMAPDQAFTAIAEAISKVPDPMQRAALAANLFSKGNMKLVNTLALGEKGLVAAQEAAEKLGITFSRDMAAQVEQANDAIFSSGQAIRGVFTQATIQLAPFIKLLADDFTNAAVDAKEAMSDTGSVAGGMAEEFGILGAAIMQVADMLQEVQKNWIALQLIASGGLYDNGQAVRDPETAAYVKALQERLVELESKPAWSDVLADRIREAREAIKGAAPAAVDMDAAESKANAMGAAETIMRQYETPLEKVKRELAEVNRLFEAGGFAGQEEMFHRISQAIQSQWQELLTTKPEEKEVAETRRGSAATKGSAEAFHRIFTAMDKGDKPEVAIQKEQKKLLAGIKQGVDEMNRKNVKAVGIEEAAGA